jgi:uncharacterized protein
MKMKKLTIDRPFELKSLKSDGTFTGYASVYGELDSHHDVVIKGAFDSSLESRYRAKGRNIPMLWQHDTRNPIGVYPVSDIKEDDVGFLVSGFCNLEVQQGREAHALMKQGALSGLSIGYNTVQESWSADGNIRILKEVDLWEISPVTFPSGDSARVTSVKALEQVQTIRELEDYLREAGHSKSEAGIIIARASALKAQGEPDADEDAKSVKRMLETVRSM